MTSRRDTAMAIGAVVIVIGFAAVAAGLLNDVSRRGRDALARERTQQVAQLSASLEARLDDTLDSLVSFVDSAPLTFTVGSPDDAAFIDQLRSLAESASTGLTLIDGSAMVTGGTLIPDPSFIGSHLERPGLAEALAAAQPTILPVADGVTTAQKAGAIVAPAVNDDGSVRGAIFFEFEIVVDSSFNVELSRLSSGDTGVFVVIDANDVVVASNNSTLLGETVDPAIADAPTGFSRAGGQIYAAGDIPSAGWRMISTQDESEFESGLGQQTQRVATVLIIAGLLGAAGAFVAVLHRLRNARAEQQRLEDVARAREEFISIVSHELRTPAAGVVGFLQTSIDHWDAMADSDRLEAVERALANSRRLHAMTRDVLDASTLEAGHLSFTFERVEMVNELESAVTAARDAAPRLEIDVDVPVGEVWVRADSDRLQQVLTNLLDNAEKNSPGPGSIDVRLTVVDGEAAVAITDRGAGLPDSELERVFDPFVRGRGSAVRGTGLGLHICKQIVESHGGRIWASSVEGMGATFTFTVPLASTTAETANA